MRMTCDTLGRTESALMEMGSCRSYEDSGDVRSPTCVSIDKNIGIQIFNIVLGRGILVLFKIVLHYMF